MAAANKLSHSTFLPAALPFSCSINTFSNLFFFTELGQSLHDVFVTVYIKKMTQKQVTNWRGHGHDEQIWVFGIKISMKVSKSSNFSELMTSFIIYIYFQMTSNNKQHELWDSLIQFSEKNPLNFRELEKEFDVGKLGLKKITLNEIRSKKILFKQRNQTGGEQTCRSWMENQYRIFMWFLITYCNYLKLSPLALNQRDWTLISGNFNKIPYFCQYSFHCSRKLKNDRWTEEEDSLISKFMNSQISKKWTCIGFELFKFTQGRCLKKPKAIRERWLSHLNPDIKRDEWSPQQELELVQKIREMGRKWSKIASILQNRSQHTVKNRYNKLVLRLKKKLGPILEQYSEQQILNLVYKQVSKRVQQQNRKFKQTNSKLQQQVNGSSTEEIRSPINVMPQIQIRNAYIFNPTIIIFAGHPDYYN